MAKSLQHFASRECEESGQPRTRKRRCSQPRSIPEDMHGQVKSSELAKILGISVPTVFLWTKSGKLKAVDSNSKYKQYDLDYIRELLKKR